MASSWRRSSRVCSPARQACGIWAGRRLVVAGQRAPADVDAGRQHQPVVRQPRAVGERDRSPLGVDGGRARAGDRDAVGGDALVGELLGAELAQAADHRVAERARGERRVRLDQGHGDARIGLAQGAGAARAGEAAARRPRRAARPPGPRAERGRSAAAAIAAPPASGTRGGAPSPLRGVPGGDRLDLRVGEPLGDAVHDRAGPLRPSGSPAWP